MTLFGVLGSSLEPDPFLAYPTPRANKALSAPSQLPTGKAPSLGLSHLPPLLGLLQGQRDFLLWGYESNYLVTDCPWGQSHHGDRVQLPFPRIHTHDINTLSNDIST